MLCHRLTSDPQMKVLSLFARRVCFDSRSKHPRTGKSGANSKTNTKTCSQHFITESGTEWEVFAVNPLNPELNPICYLLALLGAHHFLHVSRIRVKSLTIRLLMSYIYGAPILDVSRSHTTTQHSR